MSDFREVIPDNPASRLINILNIALETNYEATDKSGVIWAKILKVNDTLPELLPAYSQLFVLTEEAYESVIKFYPKQRNTHEKWRSGITNCLQTNSPYHHAWKNVISELKAPEIIDTLQVAEDNLAHYVLRTTVDELSIEKLKEEFESLKEKIFTEETFSDQLKKFLIGELEKILNVLDHYDLYGSNPIRESIYNIISNVDLENNNYPFRKQLCGFLFVVASSISIINDVADLPKSLEFFRQNISFTSERVNSSNSPKAPVLPRELVIFRKEEADNNNDK